MFYERVVAFIGFCLLLVWSFLLHLRPLKKALCLVLQMFDSTQKREFIQWLISKKSVSELAR